ncbi:MAG: DUF192 domain-containing protein [Pseudomonadota bacterium]
MDGAQEAASAAQTQGEASQSGIAATHPISGLRVIDVAVESDGKSTTFKTELALSREEQARGLMFREALADDEAMLFPNDPPQVRSFWMKNTPVSLDIIFIGADGRITNIETAMPYSLESVASKGPVIAVFEIRGGLAEELGIAAGDRVEWEQPS